MRALVQFSPRLLAVYTQLGVFSEKGKLFIANRVYTHAPESSHAPRTAGAHYADLPARTVMHTGVLRHVATSQGATGCCRLPYRRAPQRRARSSARKRPVTPLCSHYLRSLRLLLVCIVHNNGGQAAGRRACLLATAADAALIL